MKKKTKKLAPIRMEFYEPEPALKYYEPNPKYILPPKEVMRDFLKRRYEQREQFTKNIFRVARFLDFLVLATIVASLFVASIFYLIQIGAYAQVNNIFALLMLFITFEVISFIIGGIFYYSNKKFKEKYNL